MNKRRRSNRSGGGCFGALANILTLVFLMGICGVFAGFFALYLNPQLNPIAELRPIIVPTVAPTITPTITPQQLPPTFTPAPTNTPVATPTLLPSSTPIPTETPFSLVTPPTPDPRATATPIFPYVLQSGYPVYTKYDVIKINIGCGGMAVGGAIFDINGVPKQGVIIELGGMIENLIVPPQVTISGNGLLGPSGYEFLISDGPIASNKTLYIQLHDQTGAVVSDKIFFDTFDDCEKNLILINFIQTR